jgi:diketogulonate reductase-like aldo/keto reductase
MARRSITDTLALANSVKILHIGFGVWASPPDVCTKSCLSALQNGYRHIDTGICYDNENEVGDAVRQSKIPRQDVFLSTKILTAGGSVDKSYQTCIDSIKRLDPEHGYVDLFLIHSPNCGKAGRLEMWQALEKLYDDGKAKSIGVSNFGIKHIEELKEVAKIWPPHVSQIELHPWCQQKEAAEYCRKNGIVIQAYCPLARNLKADDETLSGIAKKHEATPNQVLVRYSLQKGWVPLPKSDSPDRIKSNIDVFRFDLDDEDMDALDSLDQGAAGALVQAVDN